MGSGIDGKAAAYATAGAKTPHQKEECIMASPCGPGAGFEGDRSI